MKKTVNFQIDIENNKYVFIEKGTNKCIFEIQIQDATLNGTNFYNNLFKNFDKDDEIYFVNNLGTYDKEKYPIASAIYEELSALITDIQINFKEKIFKSTEETNKYVRNQNQ